MDFENVRSGGLRGVDYLDKNDYITIFLVMQLIAVKEDTYRKLKNRGVILIHVNYKI